MKTNTCYQFSGFSLLLTLFLVPLASQALTAGNYDYEVTDGQATIIGFNSSYSGTLSITNTLGGYPVTCIGDYAFNGCSGLTGVTIPSSVTNIEDYASAFCGDGNSAFVGCTNLTAINVDSGNTRYRSVDGVLFDENLTVLIIYPGGKVGGYTVPVGVTRIWDDAFRSCIGLTGITIPASVTSVHCVTFTDCANLTGIYFAGNAPDFPSTCVPLPEEIWLAVADNACVYYVAGSTGWDDKIQGSIPMEVWASTATFDAAGGVASFATRVYSVGNAYGGLPTAERTGYTFGGWQTGPDGTGTPVTTATLVPYVTTGHTLYATWTVPQPPTAPEPTPYVCAPSEDDELTTVGSCDGYFYGESEFNGVPAMAVRGTLTVKITDVVKGKLTAKATLQKTALSFSATAWTRTEADGTLLATMIAKGGEKLDLYVRQTRIWGTLSGGTVGETLTLDGGRNRFADKADAAAQALLVGFKGYYTVALPVADSLSASDTVNAAPQGCGYLAVTVGSGGSAKIAGVLADGTTVSQASRLILFDGCGPDACVPLFSPLYSKQGCAGGLLWLMPGGGSVVTDRDLGWYVRWEKPGVGPDGFSLLLDADGGFYGTSAALAAGYLFSADAGNVPFYYADETTDAVSEALPEGIVVANTGGKLAMVKGVKPVPVEGEYDYAGENSSLATLSFAAKTGLFKGKFNLYYDYDLNGKLQHKVVSVPYSGVLTPVRDAAFADEPAGRGHCLVPENDPAVSAYKLKRSFSVFLDATR